MPFDCNLPSGECIFELGLREALQHKWLESQRFGGDLGMLMVRDWCNKHWKIFQRFRRIDHLFGDCRILQFSDHDFGIWQGRDRFVDTTFELVKGTFLCGTENLHFDVWVKQHRLSSTVANEIFAKLDPNCVRWDDQPILHRAAQQFCTV